MIKHARATDASRRQEAAVVNSNVRMGVDKILFEIGSRSCSSKRIYEEFVFSAALYVKRNETVKSETLFDFFDFLSMMR